MHESAKKSFVIFTYVVLILSTLLVFWQVRNFDFVNCDDSDYVYENLHVLNGLTPDDIIWAFTTGCMANWHPITWLSLMLDCQLFGANPGWMHLTNLLLHLANTLLLFAVLGKMTGSLWPSAFVAAAFALHPMHVESVAWIAERKDVLSTLFWMLTLLAYVSYVKRPATLRYLVTITIFAIGLLAKPMLVTLPFVLLLLDYWPLNRFDPPKAERQPHRTVPVVNKRQILYRIIIEKIPFFVISAVSSIITFLSQRAGGAVPDINTLSLQSRVANAFLSYATYIGKMFWPQNLAVFYPFDVGSFTFWQMAMCALLLLVISIFVICFGRAKKYLPVGWFWFVGTLIPVIGLVQVGEQSHADRYTYIPYIGLFIIIAWGFPELLSKWLYRKIALGIVAAIVLTALGIGTYRQVRCWNNSSTLFTHAIEVTNNNYLAHGGLGQEFERRNDTTSAIEHYEKALQIAPNNLLALNNLGYLMGGKGDFKKAIEYLQQAIQVKADSAEAYGNLGLVMQAQGNYDEAIKNFAHVAQLRPDLAKPLNNLGNAYGKVGRYQDAIESYTQAIRIEPDYAETHYNLGYAYGELSHYQDAVESYRQAIRIKQDYAEAHYNLGIAYVNLGRNQDAIESFKQAIRIKPEHAETHYNLGVAYANLGRNQDATESFRQAIRIKPDYADAHYNLGVIYLITKDNGSALEEYKILKTLDVKQANELFILIPQ